MSRGCTEDIAFATGSAELRRKFGARSFMISAPAYSRTKLLGRMVFFS